MKSNLKFALSSGSHKLPSKTISKKDSDFCPTINLSTNSRIKEKLFSKKIMEINKVGNECPVPGVSMSGSTQRKNEKIFSSENKNSPLSFNIKDLKSLHRDNYNSKDSINSNKSLSKYNSENNPTKEEKQTRHKKHISEIPPSFKNVSKFIDYSADTFQKIKKEEKSNLDPSILKTHSQRLNKDSYSNSIKISFTPTKRDGSLNSNKRKATTTTTFDEVNSEDSSYNVKKEYKALLVKCSEQEKNIQEFKLVLDILNNYIKSSEKCTEKFKNEISSKFKQKNSEFNLLKVIFSH